MAAYDSEASRTALRQLEQSQARQYSLSRALLSSSKFVRAVIYTRRRDLTACCWRDWSLLGSPSLLSRFHAQKIALVGPSEAVHGDAALVKQAAAYTALLDTCVDTYARAIVAPTGYAAPN